MNITTHTEKLLAHKDGAAGWITFNNPAKRNAIYADAQKRIMDHAVYFPLHNQVNPIAYRTNRTGYRFARAQWNVRFYEVDEVK